jgi:uncharacterized protein YneF (UPF0154 family)
MNNFSVEDLIPIIIGIFIGLFFMRKTIRQKYFKRQSPVIEKNHSTFDKKVNHDKDVSEKKSNSRITNYLDVTKALSGSQHPNNSNFFINLYEIFSQVKIWDLDVLKKNLDINGYFQRYEIIEVKKKSSDEVKYQLKIFLKDSNIHYVWPENDFIFLNVKDIKRKKRWGDWRYFFIQIIRRLAVNPELTEGFLHLHYKYDRKSLEKVYDFIHEHKLIQYGKLILKTDKDICEYVENNCNAYE